VSLGLTTLPLTTSCDRTGNSTPAGREVADLGFNSTGSNNLIGYSGVSDNLSQFLGSTTPTVGLNQILETTLANNGSSTQTLALVAGNPAVNAGNTNLTTDQRGHRLSQGAVVISVPLKLSHHPTAHPLLPTTVSPARKAPCSLAT
jgi:hypothetical protein